MNGGDYANLAYLVLLGVAILGWFIAENRASLGKTLRQFAVWGFIFVGLIAAYGLWSDIRDQVLPRQSMVEGGIVEVPRGPDGHYHLVLRLDGTPVAFVVDTGASEIVLTERDARRIGLEPDKLIYSEVANTANGIVHTAPARVSEVRLGNIVDRNVAVSVNGGETDTSLLGMSYLRRFQKLEIEGGKLRLVR